MKKLPSSPYLWERFAYNPLTGELYWRDDADSVLPWSHRRKGKKVGFLLGKYLYCELDGVAYAVAGLVWKWYGNDDPPKGKQIDHQNRISTDNRIENLRVVTPSRNSLNRSKRSDNSSGVAGISINWDNRRGRRVARYVVKHRGRYIKSTTDFEKAKAIKAELMNNDPYEVL